MNLPHVPDCIPTRKYGVLHSMAKKILTWCGWTIKGELPAQSKMIVAVAPHTSNWDFFIGIAAMFSLQLKVSFLGKASIFRWPVKSILAAIGGIAVDRNNRHGVVGQIVQEVARNDKFILGLAPEGTRSKTIEWKTGFLHIAKQANIPVVPVSFDFVKKEIFFHPAVYISGDIKQELVEFKQVFTDVCAKNPQAV
ncbi:1-acyl-sn-glycerol-3-phosphate acyltransferase [Cognaticolwellia mytili]|uniref:1-acyl-sn-glycerol-3-phosphate acyltransferase n=1 Tax=Cognaticolwellia mytili TaxID=1888913 RepID=UPI001F1917C2|nr:1-acyl-sn-glycerol-3-phosphate acyltransferase [Cognaticolwellia mytili]